MAPHAFELDWIRQSSNQRKLRSAVDECKLTVHAAVFYVKRHFTCYVGVVVC